MKKGGSPACLGLTHAEQDAEEKKFTLKSNQIKVENSKDKKNILKVSVNKKQVT